MAVDINSADHYLDHLDKQMTMQGIVTTFCVVTAAALFDRVLGADVSKSSQIMQDLQGFAYPYIIAAGIALLFAGGLFFWERGDLMWVHGLISIAVARGAQIPVPDISPVQEAIDYGDTWSIWLRYRQGLALVGASAFELALALWTGACEVKCMVHYWEISLLPFVVSLIYCCWLWKDLEKKDEDELKSQTLITVAQKRREARHERTVSAAPAGSSTS